MRAITFTLLALCGLLAASATSRADADAQQLLRESLNQLHAQGRGLRASATSIAQGGNTASASAQAGPGFASTQQSATGPGSQVAGVSQVGQKVEACARGPATSAACQTLTTADRASGCTDIAPDGQFTCKEQAFFGKCDVEFIFRDAYCLSSCNRCGANCTDTQPTTGESCIQDQCNSTAILAGPYCLKTCNRCAAATS